MRRWEIHKFGVRRYLYTVYHPYGYTPAKEPAELIIQSVKEMIEGEEIYAKYFETSQAIAFDQQAILQIYAKYSAKYQKITRENNTDKYGKVFIDDTTDSRNSSISAAKKFNHSNIKRLSSSFPQLMQCNVFLSCFSRGALIIFTMT